MSGAAATVRAEKRPPPDDDSGAVRGLWFLGPSVPGLGGTSGEDVWVDGDAENTDDTVLSAPDAAEPMLSRIPPDGSDGMIDLPPFHAS